MEQEKVDLQEKYKKKKLIESINEIRKARDEDRLVIFVGAGVSANSGVPTWGRLIKEIAKHIGYDKCGECKKDCDYKEKCVCCDGCKCTERESCKAKCTCSDRYNFTQDEYLRIPEYFYKNCKDKSTYYDFIKNILLPEGLSFKSNAIDDIIFEILPNHIITTNYDSLLEDSESINTGLYTVISDDKELIKQPGSRYIIKMHGTYKNNSNKKNNLKNIVLKETDYIEYDYTHPLISAFIKGLLVNHSFLFVGYSLNDYNLRLIMGWINYYRKQYGVKNSVKHFIVHTEKTSLYEVERFRDNNIEMIDLTELPKDVQKDAQRENKLDNQRGRLLYTYLSCIVNDTKFEKYGGLTYFLKESYDILKPYRKISVWDIASVLRMHSATVIKTCLYLSDADEYSKIRELVEKEKIIVDIFNRCKITKLCFNNEIFNEIVEIPNILKAEKGKSTINISGEIVQINKVLRLYLDNRYGELLSYVKKRDSLREKSYYLNLLMKNKKIFMKNIDRKSYIDILLCKTIEYFANGFHIILSDQLSLYGPVESNTDMGRIYKTIPYKYINYTKMLQSIFARNIIGMKYIRDRLDRQKEYCYDVEESLTILQVIQAYIYDYYFFFKENFMPLDRIQMTKEYFGIYVESIMLHYSKTKLLECVAENHSDQMYTLNEIDIDILVKYISKSELRKILKRYKISFLKVDNELNIIEKYKNLCESYSTFIDPNYNGRFPSVQTKIYIKQLESFNLLLTVLKLDDKDKYKILSLFFKMLKNVICENRNNITKLLSELYFLVNSIKVKEADKLKRSIIAFLIDQNICEVLTNHEQCMILRRIAKELSAYIDSSSVNKIILQIEAAGECEEKINIIYCFGDILPQDKYKEYLNENMDIIDTDIK